MNVLEKILKEIDREIYKQREICNEVLYTPGHRLYEKTMNVAKEIVKRHMDDATISEKEKVTSAEIVSREVDDKTYYAIKYKEVDKDYYTIGYGSYKLDYVVCWLNECFEFCGEAEVVVGVGKDINVSSDDGWIPVEERLPEANKRVLVTVKHSGWIADFNSEWVPEKEKTYYPETSSTYIGYIDDDGIWIFVDEEGEENVCDKEFGQNLGRIYDVVTHWQPLPEPYKPKN